MRALTFHHPGDVRCENVTDPTPLAATDAIVAVEAAGLCGSDLHVYRGHESGLDPGTVMGHEVLGRVVALGAGVRRLAIGDRVVSPFSTACGECFFCLSALPARCERGQLLGWVADGVGLAGAQAEFIRIPLADATLVSVAEELPAAEALLAGDVLATGWFGAELAGAGPGRSVAVVGCGAVGVLAAAAAGELGATMVFAVDGVADRRALAERFGAIAINPDEEGLEIVRQATAGRGVDSVVEAVGSPEATKFAYSLVRTGGAIGAVGVHTEAALAVSPGALYDKNLTYRAGRCPARALLPRLLDVVAMGRLPLASLISHQLPLAAGASAYAAFDRREPGWTKVVFTPPTG